MRENMGENLCMDLLIGADLRGTSDQTYHSVVTPGTVWTALQMPRLEDLALGLVYLEFQHSHVESHGWPERMAGLLRRPSGADCPSLASVGPGVQSPQSPLV